MRGRALTGHGRVPYSRRVKAVTETGRGISAFREPQAIDCEPGQAAAAIFPREPTGERARVAGASSLLRWPGVTGHNEALRTVCGEAGWYRGSQADALVPGNVGAGAFLFLAVSRQLSVVSRQLKTLYAFAIFHKWC
jgi:hypothetical protein